MQRVLVEESVEDVRLRGAHKARRHSTREIGFGSGSSVDKREPHQLRCDTTMEVATDMYQHKLNNTLPAC